MPAPPPDALTLKQLRARHPLYTRLSGDVLWELLAECGYSDEACGNHLDTIIAHMHDVLSVMHRLETTPGLCMGYVVKGNACPACAHMTQVIVPTTAPGWRLALPPFAAGCTVGCVALCAEQVKTQQAQTPALTITLPHQLVLPKRTLLCPLLEQAEAQITPS